MPKRTDIKTILILGAGPIVIGQACEFDYSGAQACKALREEGYRVVLVNSNPATIMTDPETADVTYIEPVTWPMVESIIAKERPDVLLPTMGGQTALNCALDLARHGVLEKYGVEMIGAKKEAIDMAEDREKFKQAMTRIGLGSARSKTAHSLEEALQVQATIGFPVVIRPSFTLGGTGGGIAYNREEFLAICERGLEASPTKELLIEESLIGWKEFEMEVVRDHKDNCIIVCSIENLDPMGVHTGDSITVAPYMGEDSVKPFLEFPGKWVILLVHTSNPGSVDFQQLETRDGKYVYEEVIFASQRWATADQMMYVVGATKADKIGTIRALAPDHFFLVPGVGAQGGDLEAVSKAGINSQCGLLVNSSRAIIYASTGEDFADAARKEASKVQIEMTTYLNNFIQ